MKQLEKGQLVRVVAISEGAAKQKAALLGHVGTVKTVQKPFPNGSGSGLRTDPQFILDTAKGFWFWREELSPVSVSSKVELSRLNVLGFSSCCESCNCGARFILGIAKADIEKFITVLAEAGFVFEGMSKRTPRHVQGEPTRINAHTYLMRYYHNGEK
jgi:hypothetical protein